MSTTTCEISGSSSVCVTEGEQYNIDIGSTVMLGGLLMFFIAYWLVGLIRKQWKS